ncbi:MAG TPA: hypothetical protein DCL38_04025 [Lachnospiraceae bacterium]|nr:hypothetical protein [Lachnospiraceae bacterium]
MKRKFLVKPIAAALGLTLVLTGCGGSWGLADGTLSITGVKGDQMTQTVTGTQGTGELAPAFDEDNVVLTFGVMADAHVMSKDSHESSEDLMESMGHEDIEVAGDIAILANTTFYTNDYIVKGLGFLEELAGGKLDCMVMPGDLTNTGSRDDAAKFNELFHEGLKNSEIPLIYSTGNHDEYAEGGGEGQYLLEMFDKEHYSADIVTEGPNLSRHSVVNGIHFIQVNGENFEVGKTLYTKAAHEFLHEALKKAAEDAPGQPIFVIAHTGIPGTVAGSNCMAPDFPTLIWSTDELRECLEEYPQVILLSGHTHYSQNSDRTIYQDDFTMLNIGPMQYMLTDYGFYNLGEGQSTIPEEYSEHPQAMLFDVDKNGTVRIRRYDIGLLEQQGETWYVKAPGFADSLSDFRANRAAKPGPVFENKDLAAETADGTIKLSFSRASGNGSQVWYYLVCAENENGETVLERKYHTDLFSAPQEEEMRDTWEIDLEGLAAGKYTVSVTACNVWNAMGETQTVEAEI